MQTIYLQRMYADDRRSFPSPAGYLRKLLRERDPAMGKIEGIIYSAIICITASIISSALGLLK